MMPSTRPTRFDSMQTTTRPHTSAPRRRLRLRTPDRENQLEDPMKKKAKDKGKGTGMPK